MTDTPFGAWPSPISAHVATSAGIRFADAVRVEGADVYWVESRPAEGGRSVIVRRSPGGDTSDVGPEDFDARTRVHEYGGGAYIVSDGTVYAAKFDDQRWYRLDPTNAAVPITPEPPAAASVRYADPTVGSGWMVAVQETHTEGAEPVNALVRIDLSGDAEPSEVASGHDFYAAPRLSPDGTRLAFITWDHPNMPWDGTDLWMADIDADGTVSEPRHVAGGEDESVVQPEWSPAGVLHFASDRTGWWNLYRLEDGNPMPLSTDDAEWAREPWVFALRRYAFLGDGRLVAAVEGLDGDRIVVLDEEPRDMAIPGATTGGWLAPIDNSVAFVSTAFDRPSRLIQLDVDTGTLVDLRVPDDPEFGAGFASMPTGVTFDTPVGPAHALVYPPTNPEHGGPPGEAPPAIVTIHGGPTARISLAMSVERLFWTSRGFAVIDVDYGGSTGHGRAYRERLRGEWGAVDVRDCALAAAHCASAGLVDPARLVIAGGSAGGYTVLLALALHDVFSAGVARYPVTDLVTLAGDTHKFESRYLDSLVGPYPEMAATYRDRSPTSHVDSIDSPVLLLQGSEDKVVPPSQPKAMRDALAERGVSATYIEFPGEGHGFRGADARIAALEAEYSFICEALGIPPGQRREQT